MLMLLLMIGIKHRAQNGRTWQRQIFVGNGAAIR